MKILEASKTTLTALILASTCHCGADMATEEQEALDTSQGALSLPVTLLNSMESALNQATSQITTFDVVNSEPGKADVKMSIKMQRKVTEFRVDFLSPASMKGTSLLHLSTGKIYIYLPAMGRVRQLSLDNLDNPLQGMACSLRDLSDTYYNDTHQASQASAQDGSFLLDLTKKTGALTVFDRLSFTVLDPSNVPSEIRFYNASGALVKTDARSGYTQQGLVYEASARTCTDTVRKITTRMTRTSWSVNPTISDSVFLPQNLSL